MGDRADATAAEFWGAKDDAETLQHYRTLVNAIDDGIYQLDDEGRFVAVNDVVVEMTGYARDELLGEHVSVLLDDAGVSALEREIERLRADRTDRSDLLELSVRTADGDRLHWEVRVSLLDAGDADGSVGVVRDVTDRDGSDREVGERTGERDVLSAAMEQSIDGMAILDENAEYVFVNQAHAEMYGYDDPSALVGESWRRCYDDEEVARLEAEAMPALSAAGSWRGEATGTRKDGSTFPQALSLTRLDDGGYGCVVRDLTEQTRRERALRETEGQLAVATEAASVGSWIWDIPADAVTVDDFLAASYGMDPDEVTGAPMAAFYEAIHEDDEAETWEQLERAVEETGELETEYRVRDADGGVTWLEARGEVRYDDDGEPDRMYGAVSDITDRKRREQLLEEQTELLERIAADAPLSDCLAALCDAVSRLNPTVRATVLLTDDDGDAFEQTIAPDFPPSWSERVEGVRVDDVVPAADGMDGGVLSVADVTTDERWTGNWRETCVDHGVLAGHAEPIRDADGTLAGWFVLCFDESREPNEWERRLADFGTYVAGIAIERERSRQALHEREERLRTIVENFPNGAVVLVDQDLRYQTVGGTPIDEDVETTDIEGRSIREALSPELADVLEPAYRAALDGERNSVEFERDGEHFRIRTFPVRDADGDVFAAMGMSQDVTDQVERERYLEDAKAQLEAAAEAGAVGTWEWHVPEDRFVAGVSFARKFGVDPDAAREGVPLERFASSIHEDDRERVEAKIEEAVESCGEYEAEYRVRNADGEFRWVVARGHVECDEDGNPVTFPGALTDITARKRFERRLEESNERLEQFAYAVSHDLQEPLRMVTSYLQLIERRYGDELDEDAEEFIDFAVDGAERMRDMIEGLLEYSRVETRGDPFEPVDLNDVLADVRDDLQMAIEESDAELEVASLPRVEGDEGQLRQVFQNLVDNAIAYAGDEPPRIRVDAERNGGEWVVSVSDEGIGIDPDDADRVFEVFQSLHTNDESGTGIGLALVERIVERHRSDIWLDSEPGEGATFSFTLPAADERDE